MTKLSFIDKILVTKNSLKHVQCFYRHYIECMSENAKCCWNKNRLPWSQRFFLFFIVLVGAARELRSGEHESRSGQKEKPLVTLDLNLTFMQTPGSGSDSRAPIG